MGNLMLQLVYLLKNTESTKFIAELRVLIIILIRYFYMWFICFQTNVITSYEVFEKHNKSTCDAEWPVTTATVRWNVSNIFTIYFVSYNDVTKNAGRDHNLYLCVIKIHIFHMQGFIINVSERTDLQRSTVQGV